MDGGGRGEERKGGVRGRVGRGRRAHTQRGHQQHRKFKSLPHIDCHEQKTFTHLMLALQATLVSIVILIFFGASLDPLIRDPLIQPAIDCKLKNPDMEGDSLKRLGEERKRCVLIVRGGVSGGGWLADVHVGKKHIQLNKKARAN